MFEMSLRAICVVLCFMVIYILDICDSKCDEYIIVLLEKSCKPVYFIKPQKYDEIQWQKLTPPCNSSDMYDELQEKKECILEINYNGYQTSCVSHIKPTNRATHILLPDRHMPTARYTDITNKTELDKPKIIINPTEKPKVISDEELFKSTYNINLIYINDHKIENTSKLVTKIPHCDFAKIVCLEEKSDNDSLSDSVDIETTELNKTLQISIKRDEINFIQPLFVGYLPELSTKNNNFMKEINLQLENFESMTSLCNLFEENSCNKNRSKPIKQINIYIKANYIQNNTMTIYPNCTKDFNALNDTALIECDSVDFAKNNPHIIMTPKVNGTLERILENKTRPEKQPIVLEETIEKNIWKCQITNLNSTFIANHHKDYTSIHFENCSNMNDNHLKKISIKENKTSNKDDITKETLIQKPEHKNNSKDRKIKIIESVDNCSQTLNIQEGNIIEIGTHDITKQILDNNFMELVFAICLNVTSITNNTKSNAVTDLAIILKNDSINNFDLKLLHKALEKSNATQKLVLECNATDFSNNATLNRTKLRCVSTKLEDYIDYINISDMANNTLNNNSTKEHNVTDINTGIIANKSDDKNTTVSNTHPFINITEYTTTTVVNDKKNETVPKVNKPGNGNFNRVKDKPDDMGGINLAQTNNEPEKILLIIVCSAAAVGIIAVIVLRKYHKKSQYNLAPTREPGNDEETAF